MTNTATKPEAIGLPIGPQITAMMELYVQRSGVPIEHCNLMLCPKCGVLHMQDTRLGHADICTRCWPEYEALQQAAEAARHFAGRRAADLDMFQLGQCPDALL